MKKAYTVPTTKSTVTAHSPVKHWERRNVEIQDLYAMHSCTRSPGGKKLRQWRKRWIESLPGAVVDEFDNVLVPVGKSQTIFSCHTDTVGKEKWNKLRVRNGILRANNGILGADDTVGCWIMRRMVRAGVPGLYVFHDGEETGCQGSKALVGALKNELKNFKRVVAFDRKGYDEVITYQHGGRCCSDAFANALSAQLNSLNMDFRYYASNRGVYTDSASYMYAVPECTNVGVGYFGQHGTSECLDMYHAYDLMTACLSVDWEALPTERDPSEPVRPSWRESQWDWRDTKYVPKKSSYSDWNSWDDWGTLPPSVLGKAPGGQSLRFTTDELTELDKIISTSTSHQEVQDLLITDPELVAAWICWCKGIRAKDIEIVEDTGWGKYVG